MRPSGTVAAVRDVAQNIALVGRLSRDLPPYLRQTFTAEEARRRLRANLEHRERRFLTLAVRMIYGNARSPYRRLLAHVGCEPGDLHALVAREGVEGALRHLAALGVYVAFDEVKGRRAAVRGSACFTFSDRDFDNPLAPAHYFQYTGGSGGTPTRVNRTLGWVTDTASTFALVLEAHRIRQPRHVFWVGANPTWALVVAKLGQPIDAWLYPVHPLPPLARLGLRYMALLARLAGRRLPTPVHGGPEQTERVARWLADHASLDRPYIVNAVASTSVRIAAAAAAMGRRLDGVTLRCRSEPLTPTRRRLIEDVGARALPNYASVDIPAIGFGCPHGADADDVHLQTDLYAVIARQRALFEAGPTVDALLFTTLTPNAGKIAFNTELGDSALIEERACGCLLGALGLRTHLSEIRSFEKLSTEGISFARSNLIQILEEVLPARFGGTPIDYQLVEEEGADGATRLVLRVHPGVGDLDAAALRGTLLQEMGRGGIMDAYHSRLLDRTEAVVVERRAPISTRAGKVLPFQLARFGDGIA